MECDQEFLEREFYTQFGYLTLSLKKYFMVVVRELKVHGHIEKMSISTHFKILPRRSTCRIVEALLIHTR